MTDTGSRLDAAAVDLLVALRDLADREVGQERVRALVAAAERLQPRLTASVSPLLVVLAGSTGSGTSTLVNSLVGRRVSRAGAVRPTTRVPVLVHHPDDHALVGSMLPSLPDPTDVVLDATVPSGLALLDSPDLDSVEPHNAAVASSLIETADLWVAVTSASRYADAVVWSHLTRAATRHTTTAVVLNRVPAPAAAEVSTHLATLLSGAGLADSPLIVVSEHPGVDGLLPGDAVAGLHRLLQALGDDEPFRSLVRRSSLSGAVADLLEQVETGGGDASDERSESIRAAATSLHAARAAELT